MTAQPVHETVALPTILLVDDDEMVCRSVARFLGRAGFDVTVSHSGHDALERVQSRHFDAVVTDHNMPLMNGIELIEELVRRNPELRGHIFLTSGDLDILRHDAFLKSTGSRGLEKPFQVAELASTLRSTLGLAPAAVS